MECSTPLKCGICLEELTDGVAIGQHKTGNGDVLRQDCSHQFCRACMSEYVSHRISEHRVFDIRCPHPTCPAQLFEADVQRLVTPDIFAKYSALLKQDFTARVDHLFNASHSQDHLETLRVLHDESRICPKCGVILQRSQGCNSMYCFCGTNFHYASAARVGGQRFSSVLKLAAQESISIAQARQFDGDYARFKRAHQLAAMARSDLEAADRLGRRASAGDEEARALVARLRREARAAQNVEAEACTAAAFAYELPLLSGEDPATSKNVEAEACTAAAFAYELPLLSGDDPATSKANEDCSKSTISVNQVKSLNAMGSHEAGFPVIVPAGPKIYGRLSVQHWAFLLVALLFCVVCLCDGLGKHSL
eukprot:TRINITY_DN9932_c0_g1_i3.p1 TRINITY_DN9932_c0_g1~~TRINITY_DN9932_c0_g1_i3.p1  ORF type:complete len:365 (+),score=44.60 TRINITY_DN9932_c0_g1_i3:53-1147(+)